MLRDWWRRAEKLAEIPRTARLGWHSLRRKFVNDMKSWVLVKGFAESDGISIAIYGGEHRRVESSPGTFTVTGRAPIKRVKDPKLAKGKSVVKEEGSAPSRTSVTRTVYTANGEVLRDETWTTSYRGETRIVRVGTKVYGGMQRREGKIRAQSHIEDDLAGRRCVAGPDLESRSDGGRDVVNHQRHGSRPLGPRQPEGASRQGHSKVGPRARPPRSRFGLRSKDEPHRNPKRQRGAGPTAQDSPKFPTFE